MDEVDFTILAATSVLGDLVEKCPPAEACRDAFERMSKATVKMCISSNGFSSSVSGLTSHLRTTSDMDYFAAPPAPKFATSNTRGLNPSQRHGVGGTTNTARLPKPQFDMALNDLYAPSTVQGGALVGSEARGGNGDVKTEFTGEAFAIPRSGLNSPIAFAVSPPMTRDRLSDLASSAAATSGNGSSAIDPSLLPSGQPGGRQEQNLGYLGEASGVVYGPGYGDVEFGPGGMEFLNDSGAGFGADAGSGGLDLGFGWNADGEGHDFSDGGNQLDFFDGFYFGTGV